MKVQLFQRRSTFSASVGMTGLVILVSLAGCSVSSSTPPLSVPASRTSVVSTISPFISRQVAIEAALAIGRAGRPEVEPALEEPKIVQAELMTFASAWKQLFGNELVPPAPQADTMVWLVAMEGTWQDGFPHPTPLPGLPIATPMIWHQFAIILNAITGYEITARG
jgi:hypothetical protein